MTYGRARRIGRGARGRPSFSSDGREPVRDDLAGLDHFRNDAVFALGMGLSAPHADDDRGNPTHVEDVGVGGAGNHFGGRLHARPLDCATDFDDERVILLESERLVGVFGRDDHLPRGLVVLRVGLEGHALEDLADALVCFIECLSRERTELAGDDDFPWNDVGRGELVGSFCAGIRIRDELGHVVPHRVLIGTPVDDAEVVRIPQEPGFLAGAQGSDGDEDGVQAVLRKAAVAFLALEDCAVLQFRRATSPKLLHYPGRPASSVLGRRGSLQPRERARG